MTKKDLVDFMAGDLGMTKKDAGMVITSFLKGVTKGIVEDGKTVLVGFGTFKAVDVAACERRNPRTQAVVQVPAKRVPRFKASNKLKEVVNV
jgi:DNA-binding protein HU-beta